MMNTQIDGLSTAARPHRQSGNEVFGSNKSNNPHKGSGIEYAPPQDQPETPDAASSSARLAVLHFLRCTQEDKTRAGLGYQVSKPLQLAPLQQQHNTIETGCARRLVRQIAELLQANTQLLRSYSNKSHCHSQGLDTARISILQTGSALSNTDGLMRTSARSAQPGIGAPRQLPDGGGQIRWAALGITHTLPPDQASDSLSSEEHGDFPVVSSTAAKGTVYWTDISHWELLGVRSQQESQSQQQQQAVSADPWKQRERTTMQLPCCRGDHARSSVEAPHLPQVVPGTFAGFNSAGAFSPSTDGMAAEEPLSRSCTSVVLEGGSADGANGVAGASQLDIQHGGTAQSLQHRARDEARSWAEHVKSALRSRSESMDSLLSGLTTPDQIRDDVSDRMPGNRSPSPSGCSLDLLPSPNDSGDQGNPAGLSLPTGSGAFTHEMSARSSQSQQYLSATSVALATDLAGMASLQSWSQLGVASAQQVVAGTYEPGAMAPFRDLPQYCDTKGDISIDATAARRALRSTDSPERNSSGRLKEASELRTDYPVNSKQECRGSTADSIDSVRAFLESAPSTAVRPFSLAQMLTRAHPHGPYGEWTPSSQPSADTKASDSYNSSSDDGPMDRTPRGSRATAAAAREKDRIRRKVARLEESRRAVQMKLEESRLEREIALLNMHTFGTRADGTATSSAVTDAVRVAMESLKPPARAEQWTESAGTSRTSLNELKSRPAQRGKGRTSLEPIAGSSRCRGLSTSSVHDHETERAVSDDRLLHLLSVNGCARPHHLRSVPLALAAVSKTRDGSSSAATSGLADDRGAQLPMDKTARQSSQQTKTRNAASRRAGKGSQSLRGQHCPWDGFALGLEFKMQAAASMSRESRASALKQHAASIRQVIRCLDERLASAAALASLADPHHDRPSAAQTSSPSRMPPGTSLGSSQSPLDVDELQKVLQLSTSQLARLRQLRARVAHARQQVRFAAAAEPLATSCSSDGLGALNSLHDTVSATLDASQTDKLIAWVARTGAKAYSSDKQGVAISDCDGKRGTPFRLDPAILRSELKLPKSQTKGVSSAKAAGMPSVKQLLDLCRLRGRRGAVARLAMEQKLGRALTAIHFDEPYGRLSRVDIK